MKKRAIVLAAVVVVVVTVVAYTALSAVVVKAPEPTPTPTPTPTPPSGTATSTPAVAQPEMMAAEAFFLDWRENPGKYTYGTVVAISDIVQRKKSDGFYFVVRYNDPVRGERTFTIIVDVQKNSSGIKIGEKVTAKGRVGDYLLPNWVTIKAD